MVYFSRSLLIWKSTCTCIHNCVCEKFRLKFTYILQFQCFVIGLDCIVTSWILHRSSIFLDLYNRYNSKGLFFFTFFLETSLSNYKGSLMMLGCQSWDSPVSVNMLLARIRWNQCSDISKTRIKDSSSLSSFCRGKHQCMVRRRSRYSNVHLNYL